MSPLFSKRETDKHQRAWLQLDVSIHIVKVGAAKCSRTESIARIVVMAHVHLIGVSLTLEYLTLFDGS